MFIYENHDKSFKIFYGRLFKKIMKNIFVLNKNCFGTEIFHFFEVNLHEKLRFLFVTKMFQKKVVFNFVVFLKTKIFHTSFLKYFKL